MKKKKEESAAASAAPATPVPARAPRQVVPLQPELVVEIEKCKKQITTLKSLSKTMRILEKCDRNALEQLQAWLIKKLAVE